jgi:hypothetical protein
MNTPTGPNTPGENWLDRIEAEISEHPDRIERHFPAVGRKVGRGPLDAERDPQSLRGSVDDVARARLITTLINTADATTAAGVLAGLYRHGDDAERRGVLRGLVAIRGSSELVSTGLELVNDALRTNDPRLVAAAMGEFAEQHLPDTEWRGGVLKCIFMEIPLAAVAGIETRRDAELRARGEALADERRAAGRPLSDDLTALINDHPIPA